MRPLLPYIEYTFRPVPGYAAIAQPVVEALSVRAWQKHGKPPPPRSVKASAIRRYAPGREVFIETGTFYGDTLAALQNDFARLYSIELHRRLARRAMRRFRRNPRVTIIHGDSATHLETVLSDVAAPAVLFLDGHYSGMLTARGEEGDTPVLRELDAALRAGTPEDAILIDDARLFGNDPAYPSISEVEVRAKAVRPDCSVHVDDDMIQIHGDPIPHSSGR
jgi:hypothetical protein